MTTNKKVIESATESVSNCTSRSIVLLSVTRSGKSILAAEAVIYALAQNSHVLIPPLCDSHLNAHLDTPEAVL